MIETEDRMKILEQSNKQLLTTLQTLEQEKIELCELRNNLVTFALADKYLLLRQIPNDQLAHGTDYEAIRKKCNLNNLHQC